VEGPQTFRTIHQEVFGKILETADLFVIKMYESAAPLF
jgi:hypothetical protein